MLFVSQDAARAGAQIPFLHLLGWIKEKTAIEPKIILCSGGVLEESFKEIADTLILDRSVEHAHDEAEVEQIMREFCSEDIKLIYVNTVTAGKYFDYLKMFDAPILTHVHELQKSIENLPVKRR